MDRNRDRADGTHRRLSFRLCSSRVFGMECERLVKISEAEEGLL